MIMHCHSTCIRPRKILKIIFKLKSEFEVFEKKLFFQDSQSLGLTSFPTVKSYLEQSHSASSMLPQTGFKLMTTQCESPVIKSRFAKYSTTDAFKIVR